MDQSDESQPLSKCPAKTSRRKTTTSKSGGVSSRAASASHKRAASTASTTTRPKRAKKPRVDTKRRKGKSTTTPRGKSTVITPGSAVAIRKKSKSSSSSSSSTETEASSEEESKKPSALAVRTKSAINLPPTVPNLFSSTRRYTHCQCLDQVCSRECISAEYLNSYGWEYKTLQREKENMEYEVIPERANADPLELLTTSGIVPPPAQRTRQQTEWYGPRSIRWDLDNYMDRQADLAPKMRHILVDWMVELTEEYKLSPMTFHLAVTLIDKCLACTPNANNSKAEFEGNIFFVPRDSLQCLGCACTWIAAKMEEAAAPSLDDFVYISDNIYQRGQIMAMERDVCQALKFRLQHVTPVHYAHELLLASEAGPTASHNDSPTRPAFHPVLRHMVYYLLELSREPYDLVSVKPSLMAAAAVFLARATLGFREMGETAMDSKGYWTQTLQHYSGYSVEELKDTVRVLLSFQQEVEKSGLKAVFNKYSKAKFMYVSTKTVLSHEDLNLDCFISRNS